MTRCCDECIPCCDFCIYAIHGNYEINGTDGPISCSLHVDAEHKEIVELCGYCDDFYCFRTKGESQAVKDTVVFICDWCGRCELVKEGRASNRIFHDMPFNWTRLGTEHLCPTCSEIYVRCKKELEKEKENG